MGSPTLSPFSHRGAAIRCRQPPCALCDDAQNWPPTGSRPLTMCLHRLLRRRRRRRPLHRLRDDESRRRCPRSSLEVLPQGGHCRRRSPVSALVAVEGSAEVVAAVVEVAAAVADSQTVVEPAVAAAAADSKSVVEPAAVVEPMMTAAAAAAVVAVLAT